MSRGRLLLIDTATRRAVVGLSQVDGALLAVAEWDSPHRHGEELLPRLEGLLAEAGVRPAELAGLAVGSGPGSFTGLRIGLATAKVIAYSVGCPIVGLSTTAALASAAGTDGGVAVVLPAGRADRYVARYRGATEVLAPQLLPATRVQSAIEHGDVVLAVDLDEAELGRSAAELGRRAQQGLAAALALLAAEAHAAGRHDELEALVPSYVAIPRGVAAEQAGASWSPDLR